MRNYARLLRVPSGPALLGAGLVGRLPLGMVPLAVILAARTAGYSYGEAGLVSALHAVGAGLIAPLLGRLADRYGQTRVLPPIAVAYAAGMGALVAGLTARLDVLPLAALALVAGGVFPPLSACVRVTWSTLLRDNPLKETAFALDSVMVELAFACGPLLVAAVQAVGSASAALLVAGGAALVGTAAFCAVPAARALRPAAGSPRAAVSRAGALAAVGVRAMMRTFAVAAVGFGALEVGIPAFSEELGDPRRAGTLLSLLAGGSLVGGLLYGARHWSSPQVHRFLGSLVALGVGMVFVAVPTTTRAMGAVLFAAGLFIAPTVISAFRLVDELALPGTVTEAFTWLQSAIVGGTAAGTAIAGVAVDLAGPRAALTLASVAVLLSAATAFAGRAAIEPRPCPAT